MLQIYDPKLLLPVRLRDTVNIGWPDTGEVDFGRESAKLLVSTSRHLQTNTGIDY